MKILAAIVTYNRSKLLERCIDHILGQTRKPDGLIVINNSSTDDTRRC
jgi:glycosyltransferase involved in cell wall biosynthesis